MFSQTIALALIVARVYAISPGGYTQTPSLGTAMPMITTIPSTTVSLIDQCGAFRSAGISISCATKTQALPTDFLPDPTASGWDSPGFVPDCRTRRRGICLESDGSWGLDGTASPSSSTERPLCYQIVPGHYEGSAKTVGPTNIPCWAVGSQSYPSASVAWSLSGNWAAPPTMTAWAADVY